MIVGVTGHQRLGDASTRAWVRATLANVLADLPITRGLTSLASGTDQLFADLLRDRGIAFEAIIPCGNYEAAFADRDARRRYAALLAGASSVRQLPFASPGGHAFLAAGTWVALHADLLVTVWNGGPSGGLGGTADVISLVRAHRRPWIHVDPVARTVTRHV